MKDVFTDKSVIPQSKPRMVLWDDSPRFLGILAIKHGVPKGSPLKTVGFAYGASTCQCGTESKPHPGKPFGIVYALLGSTLITLSLPF